DAEHEFLVVHRACLQRAVGCWTVCLRRLRIGSRRRTLTIMLLLYSRIVRPSSGDPGSDSQVVLISSAVPPLLGHFVRAANSCAFRNGFASECRVGPSTLAASRAR